MKKKQEPEKENSERWLLTYSDMITLLMAFFIVLYAMSNIDVEKYKKLSTSLNSALGGSSSSTSATSGSSSGSGGSTSGKVNVTGLPTMGANDKLNVTGLDMGSDSSSSSAAQGSSGLWDSTGSQEKQFKKAQQDVTKYLKDNNLADSAAVEITDRGFQVSLKENILFDSAEASLRTDAMNKIISIGKILVNVEGKIRVEGNTDNLPIKNDRYNSNWQLSSMRASNVAELMVEKAGIDPNRISAVGYGEYKPVATNATPEGRAQNRRVDIIIISDKYNAVEGTGTETASTTPTK